jgi:isocitrate/isopropylmalate dehydrogenase
MVRLQTLLYHESDKIMQAVDRTLARGLVTPDLSGRRKRASVPTDTIGQAVVEAVTDLLQMQMAYHAV